MTQLQSAREQAPKPSNGDGPGAAPLEDCASYLHKLTRSQNRNVRQQIDACIDDYLVRAATRAKARGELAAAFRASASDLELIEYILRRRVDDRNPLSSVVPAAMDRG